MLYNVSKEVLSAINSPLQEQVKETVAGAVVTRVHQVTYGDLIFMAMMDNYEGDQKLPASERKNRFRVGLLIANAPKNKNVNIVPEDVALILKYAEKNSKFSILLFGRLHEFLDHPVLEAVETRTEGESVA